MDTRDQFASREAVETDQSGAWLPRLDRWSGPIYLAIADAIGADLRSGRLRSGERLPTQRELAKQLGINFTTVTRAYDEARRRGLLSARAGSGTFIRAEAAAEAKPAHEPAIVADLTTSEPPDSDLLTSALRRTLTSMVSGDTLQPLMRYQRQGGSNEERAAGVEWLGRRIPDLDTDRVTVTAGAQHGISVLFASIVGPGGLVFAEPLSARSLRPLANLLRIRLCGVAMDDRGLLPDAFAAACRAEPQRPAALYCMPTLHNPTTVTMPLDRRHAIADIARRHGVVLIEDDAYGLLAAAPPPPLAAIAPDVTFHITTLSKTLTPGLRVAYIAAPDARRAGPIAAATSVTAIMPPPLSAAVAVRWIFDGTADQLLRAVRQEVAARHAIAAAALAGTDMLSTPESYYVWLRLPPRWPKAELIAHAMHKGISIESSDGFAIDGQGPDAVRLSLSGPNDRTRLRSALLTLADLIEQEPAARGAWSM
ncbi:MAG TPA: PLP-dependent aminotransferase family protein [Stellaceae bacterium]